MAEKQSEDVEQEAQVIEPANKRQPGQLENTTVDSPHGESGDTPSELNGVENRGNSQDVIETAPSKRKTKKKKRPASKRGLVGEPAARQQPFHPRMLTRRATTKNAPTGFEEYYADPPLTPFEHGEEQILYDAKLPFTERIMTAIRRFERNRKLDSEKLDIFYKYLSYGGIDVGPNSFQGGYTNEDLVDMDADQVSATLAQTSLGSDKDNVGRDSSVWAIDFAGVMAGFLSRRSPNNFAMDTREQVHLITRVLTNFLNYLLHHDVCPEYKDDILAARGLCEAAARELWLCVEAQRSLPGSFNIACSTLFGGTYRKMYDGATSWMPEAPGVAAFVGMTEEVAHEICKFAVAAAADDVTYAEWYALAMRGELKVIDVKVAAGFEITEIDQDDTIREFYKAHTKDYTPVGKVRAKPWKNPCAPPEDLTAEEREALSSGDAEKHEPPEMYQFFIEESILPNLFVGMKLEATIHKLNCDVWFFDDFVAAYCSFDTYLCNEMMVGWKEPRDLDKYKAAGGGGDGQVGEEGEDQHGEGGDASRLS